MAAELVETLIEWHAAETQAAVFRSLLAVEVLALTSMDVAPEMLEAVRNPLKGLYELSRDAESTWEPDEDV